MDPRGRIEGPLSQSLAHIALIVRDYDEAIAWFSEKLGFTLVEDTVLEMKRWALLAPPGAGENAATLVLVPRPIAEPPLP